MSINPTRSWCITGNPRHEIRMRLFCFPYAGGGAAVFRQWQAGLPNHVQVCPVQYPGREHRIAEPLITKLHRLVDVACKALSPYFDRPFAFYGHSLGARIAFEMTRELRRKRDIQPLHLIVSGSRAPHLPEPNPIHHLPGEAFVEELRRFSGTPAAVLENRELMEMYLPILRADFEVDETYEHTPERPLDCPIAAFGGTLDLEATREEIEQWGRHTYGNFTLEMFKGDHFFLHSKRDHLLRSVSMILLQSMAMINE